MRQRVHLALRNPLFAETAATLSLAQRKISHSTPRVANNAPVPPVASQKPKPVHYTPVS